MAMLRRHRIALLCAGSCAVLVGAGASFASAPQAGLDFDRTFASRGERGQAYYAASYRTEGQEHHVEVWRDRDLRIARRTDDAVETHLARRAGDDEWSMTVLDLKRKIRTDIDRTNLLRIGHFTDWFAQAHGLSRPRGPYRLAALDQGPAGIKAISGCRWYLLEQSGRSTRLCWSSAYAVPLVIADARGEVIWQVTKTAAGPFDPGVFAIEDRGFARNDANEDIQAD